jgi:hypothetical protein
MRMHGLIVLYDLHTQFYHKSIDGISDEDAGKRLATKANHVAWLAGSIVQERYELAKILGLDLEFSAANLFSDHQGIKAEVEYPALKLYATEWDRVSPLLKTALLNAPAATLDRILEYPGMRFSMYEMISFNTYREANCIGQIALWRRLLGYEPINYM